MIEQKAGDWGPHLKIFFIVDREWLRDQRAWAGNTKKSVSESLYRDRKGKNLFPENLTSFLVTDTEVGSKRDFCVSG